MTPRLRRTPDTDTPWLDPVMDPFEAMAQPVRRYLVELLAVYEAPTGEIAEMVQHHLGVGWPTVTKHLRVLHYAGFVRVRQEWSTRYYRLDDAAIKRLEDRVADLRRAFDDRRGDGYHVPALQEEARWPGPRPERDTGEEGFDLSARV
ncbi:hypothetical protein GCM10025867_34230 [Frondihabitans sucicola]|uniref:HTH arsR-type domain-containing protein n=1 Tax=Frondihabitans sucicola TaxID=1268041 RepID=A0ABN6Y4W4_9MICO|nr:metalloregulator ArsR/SmtB family transcription factor [Frondihabitans sucicola]BDZ51182.1 hypothetical protein GCM10025867_34230 [Frondihabitans sucicola]